MLGARMVAASGPNGRSVAALEVLTCVGVSAFPMLSGASIAASCALLGDGCLRRVVVPTTPATLPGVPSGPVSGAGLGNLPPGGSTLG
jgi:hypothetical protein